MVTEKPKQGVWSIMTHLQRGGKFRWPFLVVFVGLLAALILLIAWEPLARMRLWMEFEQRYGRLVEGVRRIEGISQRPLMANYFSAAPPEQDALIQMGRRIVPWLVQKSLERKPSDPKRLWFWISNIVIKLTKRQDPAWARDSDCLIHWWAWRPQVPAEFDRLRAQGAQAKDGSPERAAAAKAIVALRLDALPLILERVKADQDRWLLPVFGELTDGQGITNLGDRQARLQYTLDWWAKHQSQWTIPPVDTVKIPARFAAPATAPAKPSAPAVPSGPAGQP